MAHLLSEAAARRRMTNYANRLLVVIQEGEAQREGKSTLGAAQQLMKPLSLREFEMLQLITLGSRIVRSTAGFFWL